MARPSQHRAASLHPPDLAGLSAKRVQQLCETYAEQCARAAHNDAQQRLETRQQRRLAALPWQQRWAHPKHRKPWLVANTVLSLAIYGSLALWLSNGLSWHRGNLAWVVIAVLAMLPLGLWIWVLRPSTSADQQAQLRAQRQRWLQQVRSNASDLARIEALHQLQPFVQGDHGPELAAQTFGDALDLWRDLVVASDNDTSATDDAGASALRPHTALARAFTHVIHGEQGEHWLLHSRVLNTSPHNASQWDAHQARWAGLNWPHAQLDGAKLSHSQLAGVQWRHAQLQGADLSYAELHHADLSEAMLGHARCHRAHLPAATFRRAHMPALNASHAQCIASDLQDIHAPHSVWTHADMRHARLNRADLRQADLSHTQLTHADLRGAQLQGACLHRADLGAARCIDITIDDSTRLEGARFDARTQFGRTDTNGDVTGADAERERWLAMGAIEVDHHKPHWTQAK